MLVLYNTTIEYLRDALAVDGIRGGERWRIVRAQDHIRRLQATLQWDVAPELCQQLDALYRFLIDQLTIAKRAGTTAPIEVVINILMDLRSAWRHGVHEDNAHKEEGCQ